MNKDKVLSLAHGIIRGRGLCKTSSVKTWFMGGNPMNDGTGFRGVEGASCTHGWRTSGEKRLVVWPSLNRTRTAR